MSISLALRERLKRVNPFVFMMAAVATIAGLQLSLGHLSTLVARYRALVPAGEYGIRWPQFVGTRSGRLTLLVAQTLTSAIEVGVFGFLPALALFGAWTSRNRNDRFLPPSTSDTLIAVTMLDQFHSELENPFKNVRRALREESGAAFGLPNPRPFFESQPGGVSAVTPILGYTRNDIAAYLDNVRVEVDAQLARMGSLPTYVTKIIHTRDSELCEPVKIVEWILRELNGEFQPQRRMWHVGGGSLVIRTRTQPSMYATVHDCEENQTDGGTRIQSPLPVRIARIPIEEAIRNAFRAVYRRPGRSQTEPDITITTYVGDEIIWVYVTDRGDGLRGKTYEELARPGVKTESSKGLGMGLYLVDALARMEVCSYLLDDGEDGAIVRIRIPRQKE